MAPPAEPSSQPLLEDHDEVSTLGPASDTDSIDQRSSDKRNTNATRYFSFVVAIINCLCAGSLTAYSLYGHIFQERLHYSQYQVNGCIIAAQLAMYLLVPVFGYLCDRVGPSPISLFSAFAFGLGYLLAAFTYKSGAIPLGQLGQERGWPYPVMVLAFTSIGFGTVGMYLSSVTTCAKNFGRGKYKGLALACPIAAFGLSGMWQSQIGSLILYERKADGSTDVDVFKFFIFLAIALSAAGILGMFGLRIVDEEELIDDAIDELEQSGLLTASEFLRGGSNGYGTSGHGREDMLGSTLSLDSIAKARQEEEARRKTMLLNEETKLFLKDPTMWWFAAGFFLVTGPGDTFINNLGTVIGTLYPSSVKASLQTSPATHVSIVAVTSTVARIFAGTVTDILAPATPVHHIRASNGSILSLSSTRNGFTISRITMLLFFTILMSIGQLVLASGVVQGHGDRFWIVSALIGTGYGAVFSLTPIIITVIWGVENFGTNWGIIATSPAVGALVWGTIYSSVYQWAADESALKGQDGEAADDVLCYGKACYSSTFWAMAVCSWVACGMWLWAWKGSGGWSRRGIAI